MSEKIKVSELNASTTTNDNDLIMIVQTNSDEELENFKQTRENFLKPIYDEIGDIGTLLDQLNGVEV